LSVRRVFVYVQHLLGIGHLKRAATLARALAQEGMEVTLASGGPVVPGIAPASVRRVQLPPASAADLTFKKLLDEAGREIDDDWRRRRSAALRAAWRAAEAQVLLIELFPFGRRQMRFELLPLLDDAKGRAAIACSVRDILGGLKSPERRQEMLDLVERYFDRVLVHGDPGVVPFEQTFPGAERIAGRLSYTGYVVEPENENAPGSNAGRDEIIVSAGGGAVGAGLLEAAMRAKPLTSQRERTWRMLAGNNLPEEDFQRLAGVAAGDARIVLERSRTDFTTLLANCALSVSQAGYNTLMETVRAGARAVVVPFSGGHETEQALRARSFAERGLLEVVEEGALTPQSLAAAIDRAAREPRPAPGAIDLDGARKSALLIAGMIRERFP
jgi:predicted glycosyltransferase